MEYDHAPVPTEPPPGLDHHSADYEYAFTPTDAAHEHTDASVWVLVKFAIWLLVSGAVIHVGLWLMFALFVEQREPTVEAEYPLAAEASEPRLPAEPRLQRIPANEIADFRRREEAILHGYGWIDKDAGVVRIPIEDAMRLTVERGLPSRPDASATVPGTLPADSSSGRTDERRR